MLLGLATHWRYLGDSQSALVRDILGSVYDEHNAVADVRSLLGSVGLF